VASGKKPVIHRFLLTIISGDKKNMDFSGQRGKLFLGWILIRGAKIFRIGADNNTPHMPASGCVDWVIFLSALLVSSVIFCYH
jgi:hypothetical protein